MWSLTTRLDPSRIYYKINTFLIWNSENCYIYISSLGQHKKLVWTLIALLVYKQRSTWKDIRSLEAHLIRGSTSGLLLSGFAQLHSSPRRRLGSCSPRTVHISPEWLDHCSDRRTLHQFSFPSHHPPRRRR